MPLGAQRLHHRIRNRLPTPLALGAVPIGMAIDAPRVPVLFDERGGGIERITALGAEEVAGVPLGAAGDDDLALDGGFAGFAAGGEALVEVEVAVEARRWVGAVARFQVRHCFRGLPAGEEGDVVAGGAGVDPCYARLVLRAGFGVEGYAF